MSDVTTLLAGIKARAEKATEGPWAAEDYRFNDDDGRIRVTSPSDNDIYNTADAVRPNDAAFIAAARTDVPRLVAALEAVDAALAERVATLNETAERLNQQVVDRDPDRDFDAAVRYNAYSYGAEGALKAFRTAVTTALGGGE